MWRQCRCGEGIVSETATFNMPESDEVVAGVEKSPSGILRTEAAREVGQELVQNRSIGKLQTRGARRDHNPGKLGEDQQTTLIKGQHKLTNLVLAIRKEL